VDQRLDRTQQCTPAAQKATCTLGCFNRGVTSRSRDVIVPLCSVLVRHHLEHLPYERRLRELGMFSLEKCRLCGDFLETFQYLKGSSEKDGERLFPWVDNDRTRGNGLQLKEDRFRLDMKRKFFTVRG